MATAINRHAAADPAPAEARATAARAFERAERAATNRSFAEALSAYREAASADPSAPFAPTARARADRLAARSEGNFEPLSRLEEVRRDPTKTGDRAAIESLERAITSFPDGPVRGEARLVAAEAWLHKLGDPGRAAGLLEQALADPAADTLTRSLALAELVALERDRGDIEAARKVVDRYPDLAPKLREEVLRASRRVSLRFASFGALAALGCIGLASLVRALAAGRLAELRRSLKSPLPIAASLYIGGVAAVFVRLHGGADPRPFLWLGLGALAIDRIARVWRIGSVTERPAARAARAIACAIGVLAVAFLALERTDAGYLEGFGL